MTVPGLGLVLLTATAAGCATPYAYHFQLADAVGTPAPDAPGDTAATFADAIVKARVAFHRDSVVLDLTNRTDDVIQVEWNKITVDRGDGTTSRLRPAADLGWIPAGNTAVAHLVPLAFPRTGDAAAAYEGRRVDLDVPLIVRHEAVTYRFHFVVHVQPR